MPFDPIDRVRKLRAQADGTTFEPEAEACKAKALKIMAQHQLTEAQVAPPAPVPQQPIFQQWVQTGNPMSPFGVWGRVVITNNMAGDPEVIARAFQEGFISAQGPGAVFFNVRFG